jgi:transcriptional regulator with XRE-family HTH domain
MKFSDMLKNSRIACRLTLRTCSAQLDVDPSNWSKLERGISPAPKDRGTLEKWADFLGITGSDRETFFDQAALSRHEIPLDVASDERAIAALPVFFRAIRGQELTGKRMNEFLKDLKEIHSPSDDL